MLTSDTRTPSRSRTTWKIGFLVTAVTRPAISANSTMPAVPTTTAQVSVMPNRAPVMPLVTRFPMSTKPPIAVMTPSVMLITAFTAAPAEVVEGLQGLAHLGQRLFDLGPVLHPDGDAQVGQRAGGVGQGLVHLLAQRAGPGIRRLPAAERRVHRVGVVLGVGDVAVGECRERLAPQAELSGQLPAGQVAPHRHGGLEGGMPVRAVAGHRGGARGQQQARAQHHNTGQPTPHPVILSKGPRVHN